jgi:hypothetical protein
MNGNPSKRARLAHKRRKEALKRKVRRQVHRDLDLLRRRHEAKKLMEMEDSG